MSYQVTARKWRPMVFEDVVGQSHVTNTLQNAISTNRVAHAFIFSGTRGCGKTTTARILARALNCLSPVKANPDNACEICQEITNGRSLDVIEIDGASNRGVEEIRNLRESVRYTPTRGKFKIYIIDEVHMLTKEAFNALLKTLEEPPAHVVFIFATTEVHKVPMTILSRCQRFDFRRIAVDEIIRRLTFIANEEKVRIDDDALMIIAKKGDGSLRDAQSIFDQVRSFCGNEIKTDDVQKALNAVDQELFFRVTSLFKGRDTRGAIELVEEIMRNGYDLREFVSGLAEHLRNILIVLTTDSAQLIETSEPFKKRYKSESSQFSEQDVIRLIKSVNDLEQSIRWAPQPRFKLEAALVQMIKMEKSVQIDDLLRQLDDLKKKLEGSNGTITKETPGDPTSRQLSSEVKVIGSVSAGRLKTAAAMSYSSFMIPAAPTVQYQSHHPAGSWSPIAAPAEPAQNPVATTQTMSNKDAGAQWSDFVNDVLKTKIAVGNSLRETRPIDMRNGLLRIGCPDEYHFSTLKRHREYLAEAYHKLTGKRVSVEPVLNPSQQGSGANPVETQSPEISSKSGNGVHPLLEVLQRELGAEKIE
ncbi:MAG: DNA polymerase III subunit gamma/tau [Bacteroidota bacterium]